MVCRLDIGYAVTVLSRFAQAPAHERYMALKNVCRYLRRTKDWGLIYWCEHPDDSLPSIPLDQPLFGCPPLPTHSALQLVDYVHSSAHATTDVTTRRSVTLGLYSCWWQYCLTSVNYKLRLLQVLWKPNLSLLFMLPRR
jgi:hypothetical protein